LYGRGECLWIADLLGYLAETADEDVCYAQIPMYRVGQCRPPCGNSSRHENYVVNLEREAIDDLRRIKGIKWGIFVCGARLGFFGVNVNLMNKLHYPIFKMLGATFLLASFLDYFFHNTFEFGFSEATLTVVQVLFYIHIFRWIKFAIEIMIKLK